MNIPEFKTTMEQAQFRVDLKHKLRRAGLKFDKELPTEELIKMCEGLKK